MKLLLALLVASLPLVLAAAPAAAQEPEPQDAFMVHLDTSGAAPAYIPGTAQPFVIVPGGLMQLMLFGKGPAHSLTLDVDPSLEADVPASEQEGFYERTAELHAPTVEGTYAFHDRHDPAAHGTLIVRARGASAAPSAAAGSAATNVSPTISVGEGYDTRFYPARLEVAPGAEVRFVNNNSQIIHTLTAADGSFDADAVSPLTNRTFVAPTAPGEYAFFCKYHREGGMVGVLVVKAAAAQTPAPAPAESAKRTPGVGAFALLATLGALACLRRK